jgi:hypothetical protein
MDVACDEISTSAEPAMGGMIAELLKKESR